MSRKAVPRAGLVKTALMIISDIDSLVIEVLGRASLNPKLFATRLHEESCGTS